MLVVETILYIFELQLIEAMIRTIENYVESFGSIIGRTGIVSWTHVHLTLDNLHEDETHGEHGEMIPPLVGDPNESLFMAQGVVARHPFRMLQGCRWPGRFGKLTEFEEEQLLVTIADRWVPGMISRQHTRWDRECDITSMIDANACVPGTSYAIPSAFTSLNGHVFWVQYTAKFANFGYVPILRGQWEPRLIISVKQIESLGYRVEFVEGSHIQVAGHGNVKVLGIFHDSTFFWSCLEFEGLTFREDFDMFFEANGIDIDSVLDKIPPMPLL